MKVSDDLRLVLEDGEAFNYHFDNSPNFRMGLSPDHIVVYCTQRRDLQDAVSNFKTPKGDSAHLIIGRDGKEIVQMETFDRAAAHNMGFNNTALAVELDYPGELTKVPNRFNSIDKFDPSQVLNARPLFSTRTRPWPLFPKAQLDTLLVVMRALLERFEPIHSILGNDEVFSGEVDPGPAFPRTLFREKLLGGRETLDVLDETNQEATLRAGPGAEFLTLYQDPLPKGTQVSMIFEEGDWLLIEALAELQGNPWIVGWIEKRFVSPKIYVPQVVDNRLLTQEGRRYLFKPADPTNYDGKRTMDAPKYIIMHFTTGTEISTTINEFQSPFTASAHLLIARDGRVIQFVPFNKSAFHVGFAFWEGESNLNKMTFGIELDNAGFLRRKDDQWMRGKKVIPPEQVEEAIHWKEFRKRAWEKFPDVQIQVAHDIVTRLVKQFNIQDILGHDMINLLNRGDPGPLFQPTLEEWRQEFFGRKDPAFKPFVIADKTGKTPIFTYQDGVPAPFTKEDQAPPVELKTSPLENGTVVRIQQKLPRWTLVFVFPNPEKRINWMQGWVNSNAIKPVD